MWSTLLPDGTGKHVQEKNQGDGYGYATNSSVEGSAASQVGLCKKCFACLQAFPKEG
jgi:hypothetical protein